MMRDFLTITDVSEKELSRLLMLAVRCKANRRFGGSALKGKTVALVFQKPSMRTRVAFEVAVHQLGGAAIYLDQQDIQLGVREPINDVARALSRYVDAIVVRTFAHADAEAFATSADCPVINGLSDAVHPCQALADLLTIQEAFGRLKGLRVAYIGDGNNVLHSLLHGCAMMGAHVTVATPPAYKPHDAMWKDAVARAKHHGAVIRWTSDPTEAATGAEVLYTDVWVSMGQEKEREARLKVFRPYQINARLLKAAQPGCIVLHCLPAHRGEEITDDIMEHRQSRVFDQAENRLHVQKALLMWLCGKG
ncbi:MAG: ornithine carbamoyltransferase [Candidatus Omnitrophica bacterium]|nr:ornithine carbamoyltransferase [Candidatus Omnitrophota bacterium]